MKRTQFHQMMGRMAACMAAAAMLVAPITANAATISYESKGDGDTSVPVVATYEGTRPGALIPSTIEFEGGTGRYTVYAFIESAKVSAVDTSLNIVPQSSFTMTKEGTSSTATATVTQDKTSFGRAELAAGQDKTLTMTNGDGVSTPVTVKQAPGNGTIAVNGMTKGTWKGNLVFTIS